MELLVAAVLAYYLMRHGPQLVAEALAEADYTHRGEMSPRRAARLKRLTDAGIDPAAGGAARQFLGNAWRDAWLDLEDARTRRRGERKATGGGGGFAGAFDAAVDAAADRWRRRNTDEPAPDEVTADTPPPPPADTAPGDSRPPAPQEPGGPIVVPSTQGEPIRTPAPEPAPEPTPPARPAPEAAPAPEGNTMTGTAVVHVTGVASAAHEARNIANQISAVTEAYKAALDLILRRATNLGQTTVGEIQQALSSRTVQELQAACEALAAAKANADTAVAEAAPAMNRVARAFDRIV